MKYEAPAASSRSVLFWLSASLALAARASAQPVYMGIPPAAQSPLPAGAVYERGPDYRFRPLGGRPRVGRPLGGPHALVSGDGNIVLLFGSAGGSRLLNRATGRAVRLGGDRIYRAAFAPDGSRLITSTEEGQVTVFAVPTGAVERRTQISRTISGGAVAFVEPRVAVIHTGCRLLRIDLGSAGDPRAIGLTLCNEATAGSSDGAQTGVSLDGRTWMSAMGGPDVFVGERMGFLDVHVTDAATGSDVVALRGTREDPILEPFLSPAGDRICFAGRDAMLRCSRVGGPTEVVASGVVSRYLAFDEAGGHLSFMLDADRQGAGELMEATFQTRTVRRIAHSANRFWVYLPGGRRLVAYNGVESRGVDIFDLDAGWSISMMAAEEPGGVTRVPGGARTFLIGRERGASREMFQVDLPE